METSTKTGSIKLIPSGTITGSNFTTSSSYPVSNGYNDSTYTGNGARFSVTQSATGYIYYTFDTSDIPDDATITSISGSARVYVNNTTRVTNTTIQLYSGTTAKGSSVSFGNTSTSNTVTLSPGAASTWTRAHLNDLRLRIEATASSSSSSRYVYFKGADITIGYSYTETTYDVSLTNNSSVTVTASASTAVAGETVTITANTLDGITVTDNNTNVNSQFVLVSTDSDSAYPTSNTNSNFTLTNIDNAYNDSDSTTYATLQLAGSTTGTIYFNFPSISLPSGATLQSVACSATLQFNANGSSSGFTSSFQTYAGSTAKGSATQWVSSGSNVAKNTYNVTMGTWTTSDLASPKFYITATNSARSTARQIYVYGATLTVTYQMASGGVYVYTISNISADHVIIVSSSAQDAMYIKVNGSWVEATAVYKKVNGSWVAQTDLTNVFDNGTNYIAG